MPDEPDAVAFLQVEVDILQRLDHHGIRFVPPNRTTSRAQKGLFHGACFGIEDGEINACVVGIDADCFVRGHVLFPFSFGRQSVTPSNSHGSAIGASRVVPVRDQRQS